MAEYAIIRSLTEGMKQDRMNAILVMKEKMKEDIADTRDKLPVFSAGSICRPSHVSQIKSARSIFALSEKVTDGPPEPRPALSTVRESRCTSAGSKRCL